MSTSSLNINLDRHEMGFDCSFMDVLQALSAWGSVDTSLPQDETDDMVRLGYESVPTPSLATPHAYGAWNWTREESYSI